MELGRESRLFALPRKVRDDIYRRVLVIKHPLGLFTDGDSQRIELFAPERPPVRWLALLYTSRQLHAEASATLYGSHNFLLVETARSQADLLDSLLRLIGPVNAGHLSHMSISFPAVESPDGQAVELRLREDDLRGLELLQKKCRGLKTLELYVQSQNSRGLKSTSDGAKSSQGVRKVLSRVEAELKAIPSLSRVFVRLYNGSLATEVTELLQSFGWDVSPGR
ncbi:hypothetical protein QBC42DRAFT_322609 [Cladorrhinum samala]|uniref:Uncharacterized protein n=1 Tax=Cladorrhinum samala TaxID=585594 RepID=A0AAV9H7K5_9PEZI|nr:hypothetical protein QBC42DRAFT_322609 [Cladorrhinum samala]